jgi:4-amino-4-deoxy-L-arabinose transferase-like glycosyltransferase
LGLGGLYFACSIAEIALAFAFANYLWGSNAALWAAATVAVLPLNVSLAGSLNPDAYLALVIELSFVTFYFAQRNNSSVLYLMAGLLAGWVGWVKEAVALYVLVFIFVAISEKRWRIGLLWFVLGGLALLVGNLMLFGHLTGDPFYGFHIFQSHLSNDYLIKDTEDTSAWTYFVFLFVKVYHTGLLGPLTLAAVISALRHPDDRDLRFVLIWACGLLLAFSILPISFSPLKFVPKQTNYIAIFMMPFALLTGWFLARQRLIVKIILGGALIGSSIILAAMEQQAIRVVTANGSAARNFASQHPDVPVFGSETVERQSSLYRLLGGSLDGSKDIRS